MDGSGFARAVLAGGLWSAISSALLLSLGETISPTDVLMEGGLMAGSALAADALHASTGMSPTGVTSAVATGALFSGAMAVVRGSDAYVSNAVAGAGVDIATEYIGSMYY